MSDNVAQNAGPEQDPETPVEAGETTAPSRRHKRRWWPFIVAGALVLAVAGGAIYWQLRPKASAAATDQFVAVSQQTLKQTVSATGTIEPARESALSFDSSGTVTGVNVEVGDKVTKGEVLATMDDASLQAAVDSAKAALTASRDNLTTLEDDSSTTDTALASAKADVKLKKSQLEQAKEALAGAELKAPFSGIVADVGIATGDATGSSGSSGSGSGSSGSQGSAGAASTAAPQDSSTDSSSSGSSSGSITVISTNAWTVSSSVGGSDLSSVKKGLQVQITPSGSTDTVFGTVQTVGVLASSSDSGTSSFPVTIKITGSPKGLHAGESATVSIIVKQISNALVVPTLAVKTANGQAVVQKKSGNGTVQTKITIGDTYGTFTQVKSGLKVGDQVKITLPTRVSGTGSGRSGNSSGGTGLGGGFPGGGSGGFPGGGSGGLPGGGQVGGK